MVATATERTRRRFDAIRRVPLGVALLAVVAYVPLLLTRPGEVGADTKSYLYLDPGRLLSRAPWMWDPNVGLGTITHQNIGYLWPMGPYYWLMDALAVPDWVAQRLWLGSIILLAGLGVRFMLRELRWVGAGLTVASFAYALSPYLLDYAARISVILLPFVGLPWLIGLAARSLRRDDWRSPAAFALVTLTVGGVNATSLLLVMVAPMLWFPYAVLVEREVGWTRAVRAGLRITVLTVATSLWWVAGLVLQGSYGIPILRYTETYETVANASLSTELLRGLGYWFFYGTDGLGPWTASSVSLVESVPALALSFLLPVLAIAAALATRWRHRIYFAVIVAVGMILAVGAHPWDESSPYGALFRSFTGGDLGLSFRSTPRAVPLIALGLAVFLAAGVAALSSWRPRWQLPVAGALIVLVCLNMLPLFRGQLVDRNLVRESEVPGYWVDAAAALDSGDRSTRVWELPGIDFAAYRWGNTVDPITPGLMDREFVARELIPYGTPPSANLVNDIDLPFQSAQVEPAALAPLARIMGVGDVLVRGDLQYERYRAPKPRMVIEDLRAAPGFGEPIPFGDPRRNAADARLPLDDEMEFAIPLDVADPAPVTVFPVEDPRSILRTVDAGAPTVLAGDGAGLVAMASVGLLPPDRPVLYSAALAGAPDDLDSAVAQTDATLVVSDTNRRQARRWGGVRENDGYTERAGEVPLVDDRTDNRLEVFPDATDDDLTVTEQLGGATVAASAYGNGVTYTPGDRAINAFDDDPSTAWRVGAFDDPVGEFIEVRLDEPVTTDRLTLLGVQGAKNRYLTEMTLSFDRGDPVTVALGDAARVEPGQEVTFPERTFSTLRITIDATDRGPLENYRGVSDVGLGQIRIPGLGPLREVVRPPTALLDAAGVDSLDRQLFYVFTRRASAEADVLAADEERSLQRWVVNPVARDYGLYGRAKVSSALPDERVDALLGLPAAVDGGVTATSSARLPGDLASRASAAIDGDPDTAYRTPLNQVAGQWVEATYPETRTVDGLDLQVVADGRHSVPTAVSLSVDGAEPLRFDLDAPAVPEGVGSGSLTTLRVPTGELTGTTFRLTIDTVDEALSIDWFGRQPIVLPVAVVESGLPVVERPAPTTALDGECRDDLVSVDGDPVPVRLEGTLGAAAAGATFELRGCAPGGLSLDPGRRLLTTADGDRVGVDVEQLVLSSAPGGGPGPDTLAEPLSDGPPAPPTTTERTGRTGYQLATTDAQDPYWLVLGQSWSPGWRASTGDGVDLGEPTLINGYANGWLIDPAVLGADVTVDISFGPQRLVWLGIVASLLGLGACIALILWPRLRGTQPPRGTQRLGWARRLRWTRRQGPAPVSANEAVPGTERAPGTEAVPGTERAPDADVGPMVPVWSQLGAVGVDRSRGWRSVLLVALGAGLVGVAFVGPVAGAALAALSAVALAWRHGRWVLPATSLGLVAAASGYVVLKQWRNAYELDFDWMQWFEVTHQWTFVAVLALVTAVVVDTLRSTPPEPDRPPDPS